MVRRKCSCQIRQMIEIRSDDWNQRRRLSAVKIVIRHCANLSMLFFSVAHLGRSRHSLDHAYKPTPSSLFTRARIVKFLRWRVKMPEGKDSCFPNTHSITAPFTDQSGDLIGLNLGRDRGCNRVCTSLADWAARYAWTIPLLRLFGLSSWT